MSTASSSTEAHAGRVAEAVRAAADVGALLSFRASGVRGRSRRLAYAGLATVLTLTVLAGWLPAYLPGGDRRTDVLSLLPSAMVGILVIAIVSAAASGGGRELVPRDQAVAYPVSTTTDHLGALLMAPLNIAWLLQAWTLLAAMAYVGGAYWGLVLTQLLTLLWLVTATALAQVVGWALEWVRRGPHGTWAARGLMVLAGLGGAYLVAADRLVPLLQKSPTLQVSIAALQGRTGVTPLYAKTFLVLLVVAAVAVVLGAVAASAVNRRPARDELRLETSTHQPRPHPGSDLVAMLRTDRVGIWRSVPLRRGLAVLAVMPGLVAIAGGLEWEMLPILPGLVASGGALLFGVNAWCLDGRGALWRDSLPVAPGLVFLSRVLVLVEVLLVASAATLVMASLRAGLPTVDELAAVTAAALVVVLQVVSASLRWSVRRPFGVDLRSARATPAPPLVMVGYSARLALSTTMVGLVFSLLVRLSWEWSVAVAVPFLLLSAWRLVRTANAWGVPEVRSRVVATVAA
ncbi:hypothetical protein [Nocardioides caldifontis]|uniref:hypothetical protein n=1 Tax=Nocardioides caldifontis TaxID=2588938 RepID=UPI0011E01302|nr:hypothetical protein [Nocardioides caldifontis]